ncbi:MAG: 4'-phosphopantetheinyl transferase superfamily protein [Ekhidna sp.]|nr:4'-phosphopantetheinyl transferase superfamily protein [Ekhidna sp.]
MLGIDIVNLNDPFTKKKDKRAFRLIQHSNDVSIEHSELYWLLWAAKEAVFKCRREAINFSPTSIPIELSDSKGVITFQSEKLEGGFQIANDFIMAVCSENLKNVRVEIFINEDQVTSNSLRSEIMLYFDKKGKTFTVGSDELNLPILLPSCEPVSISHDGNIGAFAYPKYLIE